MVAQVKADGKLDEGCMGLLPEFEDIEVMMQEHEVKTEYCSGRFKDDLTGQPLVDKLVIEARHKELQYFTAKGVWIKRPRAEAKATTGKSPISVRWVDVNKGDCYCPAAQGSGSVWRLLLRPGATSGGPEDRAVARHDQHR